MERRSTEGGEQRVDVVGDEDGLRAADACRDNGDVLGDGEVGEDAAALGQKAQAEGDAVRGGHAGEGLVFEGDVAAARLQQAHDGFQCRGFAGAVMAEQSQDLARGDGEGDIGDDGLRAVAGREVVECEHS